MGGGDRPGPRHTVKTAPAASRRVAVIINPISGLGARPDTARRRAELAAVCVEAHHVAADIFVTERRHHARELAHAAVANGATTVIAWGGDGTVNEVASALAFGEAALGVVPSGSGNGLARELALPLEPRAAFEVALGAHRRRIDAGELDGHLFFNVAGIGLDADVAHRFAAGGLIRRGLAKYVMRSTQALLSYRAVPLRSRWTGSRARCGRSSWRSPMRGSTATARSSRRGRGWTTAASTSW